MARGPLVLGIGNLLMGDEGVGVHVVAALGREPWPPDVTIVDGGTGGFHLLSLLLEHDSIVLIDATMDGRPAGAVRVLRPRYASDFPRSLTAHDIGLRDLIESAVLLEPLADMTLVTVSITEIRSMTTSLSRPVQEAIPVVTGIVRQVVNAEVAVHA